MNTSNIELAPRRTDAPSRPLGGAIPVKRSVLLLAILAMVAGLFALPNTAHGQLQFSDLALTPMPVLVVTSQYTGPGCCYQFTFSQVNGGPGIYNEIVATITTAGTTVTSASSDDGAPPPQYNVGGTTVRFFTRSSDGLFEDPHLVTICVDSVNVFQPPSVRFQGYNSNGITCGGRLLYLCTEDLLLSDPSCLNTAPCVVLLPNTFTSDRFGGLPVDRMQVVAMYDGSGEATLELELWNPSTLACCWLTVFPINNFDIVTQEYDMLGFEPTGQFRISGVVPNGAIDGVAFGLYLHDAGADRWMFRSAAPGLGGTSPNFVGGWPIAWPEATWDAKMAPWLNGTGYDLFVARRQAQMALSGGQLLPNGTWGTPTGRITGDVNGDGCVDDTDYSLVVLNYGDGCCD